MIIHDLSDVPAMGTGCWPRTFAVGARQHFPVYGTVDDCPILPRSEWGDYSMRHQVWAVVDQNPQNSCCPAATTGAAMIIREMTGGERILLSQGSLYGQINHGRDQGAEIAAALEAMMQVGQTPVSMINSHDWQGRNWPTNWKEEAKKFRILEAFDCPNFDAVASAVQRNLPVVFGVYWGSGGHAITAIGLKLISGKWNLEFLNSWGISWGDKGVGFLPESQCSGITKFGAFATRSMVVPSTDKLPPVLKG